jgi:hypothetical protein
MRITVMTLFAVATTTSGCKVCHVRSSDSSVDGTVAYTEPLEAHEARLARIETNAGGPASLAADRARAQSRVVDERRAFEQNLSVTAAGDQLNVSLRSEIETSFDFEGTRVRLPVSVVTITFGAPKGGGEYALADVGAKVCESVEDPRRSRMDAGADGERPDTIHEVCGDVVGTLSVRPTGSGEFDAALVFARPANIGDSPALTGEVQLHFQAYVEHELCPDLGGGGGGIFSP